MKRLTLFFLLCFTKAFSQNLVYNGNFEIYSKCPDGYGLIDLAMGWTQLEESSDYYNACVKENDYLGVPYNSIGYQKAHSGNGYAGLFLFSEKFNIKERREKRYIRKQVYYSREHIQTKLVHPLVKNKTYNVSAYISLADSSKFYTNKLSFCFSRNSNLLYKVPHSLLTTSPEFKVTYEGKKEFMDTQNWQKIELEYLAHGGEQYLTISLFKEDTTKKEFKDLFKSNKIKNQGNYCYYYVDDVSVTAK